MCKVVGSVPGEIYDLWLGMKMMKKNPTHITIYVYTLIYTEPHSNVECRMEWKCNDVPDVILFVLTTFQPQHFLQLRRILGE